MVACRRRKSGSAPKEIKPDVKAKFDVVLRGLLRQSQMCVTYEKKQSRVAADMCRCPTVGHGSEVSD